MSNQEAVIDRLRRSFLSGKSLPVEYRKAQLRNLLRLYDEGENELLAALKEDLNKPTMEAVSFEIDFNRNIARGCLFDLDTWTADEYVEKNMVTLLDTTYIHREPFGVCLVLGAWNYPVQLSLAPMSGAIAAGNCVVVKPSELAPKTASVIAKLVAKYMDPDCFAVVLGGIPETTQLLSLKFDYIFYTGGAKVGRIIANAAAKNLTPCTLELGGKCPLYLDDSVDMNLAVKRIVWGKLANLGQTCVAPDYVLCNANVREKFITMTRQVQKEFYGDIKAQESTDLCRLISDGHFHRLKNLLESTRGNVVIRGDLDEADRFVGLTVVTDVDADDPLMHEEIFGPVLPIVTVKSHQDAIDFIKRKEKPLSLYIFTENKKIREDIIQNTSSGSVCCNDVIVQLSVETLPFGGIGESGYGSYHGKYTYQTFSHNKSVLVRDFGFIGEALGKFRYPPYNSTNMATAGQLLKRRNFPKLPKSLPYLACVGLGVIFVIAIKAIAQSLGKDLPEWL